MGLRRFRPSLFAAAFISAVAAGLAFASAQSTGMITATVFDSQTHARIAGARVTFSSAATQAAAQTNRQGAFTLFSLASGLGTLVVNAAGYEPAVIVRCVRSGSVDHLDIPMFRLHRRSAVDVTEFYHRLFAARSVVEPGETADRYSVGPC